MRRFGTALALTGILVSGCSTGNETQPQQSAESSAATPSFMPSAPATATTPPPPTYEQAKAEVVQDFADSKVYWASQNVNLSAIQLQIVEGNQSVTCGNTYTASDRIAAYCYNIGKLFVTQAWLEYEETEEFFPRSANEILPRAKVTVFHEMGHAAQAAKVGKDLAALAAFFTDEISNPVPYELDADCKAGQTFRGLDPGVAELINGPNFVYFPGDERVAKNIHGTSDERIANVRSGFNGGPCPLGQ